MESHPPLENQVSPVPGQPPRSLSAPLAFTLVAAAAALTGVIGYYLGTGSLQVPLPIQNDTVCTLEAKVCPDGSSVGRTGPQCEFAACPGESSSDVEGWKTFSSSTFPGTFQLPSDFNVAEQYGPDENFHIYINKKPITFPEIIDSPFTSMEITVVEPASQAKYDQRVAEAKQFYLAETLTTRSFRPGLTGQPGTIFSGTYGDGYAGGGKVDEAFFKTPNGYLHINYYPFIDENFTAGTFNEILATFDFDSGSTSDKQVYKATLSSTKKDYNPQLEPVNQVILTTAGLPMPPLKDLYEQTQVAFTTLGPFDLLNHSYFLVTATDIPNGQYSKNGVNLTIAKESPQIIPYIEDAKYCQADTDCGIRYNFCNYGAFNKYHLYYDTWGCGEPSYEGFEGNPPSEQANEGKICANYEVKYAEAKCVNKTCQAVQPSIACN